MIGKNHFFIVTILCLQTVYNCILSIIGQYIYAYFLKIYPDVFPANGTNHSLFTIKDSRLNEERCAQNTTNGSDDFAQVWAQQRSADLIYQATLWRAIPVIITTYIFGLYASYLNRRLMLCLSIFGNTIYVFIWQAIIYKNLAEYWWFIAAFIAGSAGGTGIISVVINLIITESTDKDERSAYFVRLGGLNTALSAVVTFGMGYYIQWRGFTDLFWTAIALEFASMLVVLCFLKSSNSPSSINESTSLISVSTTDNENVEIRKPLSSHCSHCFDICTIFNFKHRSQKKSIGLLLILISYIFYLLAFTAMAPLLWYLLGAPFCWSSKDLGNFSAVSMVGGAIFSVLGMKVLTYCGATDPIICAFGHVCAFGYTLMIASAQRSWQLFLSLVLSPFSGYQSSLTLSMMSKWLEVNERNDAYTLVTEVNIIVWDFGSSFFNWVYARTVTHQKNFTLLFASGLCVIPFILNLYLFFIARQITDEQPLVPIDPEPITLSLPNILPSQAADLTCIVLPNRSRANSHSSIHDQDDGQILIY